MKTKAFDNDPVAHILYGLNIIITGGAQGLGLGMARNFAHHGARIFILDKNPELALKSAKDLPGEGHLAVECDVTNQDMRNNAVSEVIKTAGTIDVLVNNAGITHIQEAEEMNEEKWRMVFDVNIHGMMFMCREVAQYMLLQGAGSIINIGSITSLVGFPLRSAYATTKTAVLGLTRSLAVEWAQRGVRVNAIGPGYHDTALFREYVNNGLIDENKIRKRIPMGRLGTIDDLGRAAVFFASSLSQYVTGQFLMVDGGYTAFGAAEDASV
jgi:NAD(P)-dependent dehydrogenase (short-subunit alcohol dehydrogenase family)